MIQVISLSGGKDSTALAVFYMERYAEDDLRFVFCDTGNEHPITYDYMHYLRDVIGKRGWHVETLKADFSKQVNTKRQNLIERPRDDWEPVRLQRAIDNLKPSHNAFLDLCMARGRFPSPLQRFCTQELKLEPVKAYVREIIGGARTAIML